MDLIGCITVTDEFALAGTCGEQMYGMSEALWQPDLEPEELFESISQAMMNAFDRDAVSGMGAVVHIMYVSAYFTCTTFGYYYYWWALFDIGFACYSEKDKVTTRRIKTRMD